MAQEKYCSRQDASRRNVIVTRTDGSFSNRAFGSSSFPVVHSDGIDVSHPGHASLRSLIWPIIVMGRCTHVSDWLWSAPLRLAVFGRSRHIRRHPRTSSGEDDPVVVVEGVRSCGALRWSTAAHGGTRCRRSTCDASRRQVFWRQRRLPGGGPSDASGAGPSS